MYSTVTNSGKNEDSTTDSSSSKIIVNNDTLMNVCVQVLRS